MLFLKWESCWIFLKSTMKNKWLYSCICKNYKRFLALLNCVVDLKDSLCHFVVGGACVWWLYEGHSVWPLCLQSASPHRHHICVRGGKCGALCHREGKLVYSQQFKILSYPGYSFVKETCIFPLIRCRAVGEIYEKFEFEACYVSLLFYSKPRVNQEQCIIVHQLSIRKWVWICWFSIIDLL